MKDGAEMKGKPTTIAGTIKTRRPILSKWTAAVGGKGQVVLSQPLAL